MGVAWTGAPQATQTATINSIRTFLGMAIFLLLPPLAIGRGLWQVSLNSAKGRIPDTTDERVLFYSLQEVKIYC